jgi:hypothetical protein
MPWQLLKRGHTISYAGLFLFTFILYFRPYEFSPALSWLSSSAFWVALLTILIFIPTQLGLEGKLTVQTREVSLLLVLTFFALLSIPVAHDWAEAWKTFSETFIKVIVIFIVMVNVVRTDSRLNGLFLLSFAVSLYLSLAALRDFAAGKLTVEGYRVRGVIGGMFGNPNDMAIHLVLMVPLAIGLALAARGYLKKLFFLLNAALFVAGIVVTYSRGAFLALMASGAVLAWKLGRRNRIRNLAISAGLMMVVLLVSPGNYATRILSIFGLAPDPVGSSSARQTLLIHSLKVALRNPFGVGLGNYHYMAPREAVSHNAYTQVATEMGLVALVVYLLFMITSYRRHARIEHTYGPDSVRDRYYYLAVALQVSLIAYLVSSFFGSVAYQWYVYYIVGYAICLERLFLNRQGLIVVGNESLGRTPHENLSATSGGETSERSQNFP